MQTQEEHRNDKSIRRPNILIREHKIVKNQLNNDQSPEIIRKNFEDFHEPIVYRQEIAVRYLCPPTPPPPPPLIIREIQSCQSTQLLPCEIIKFFCLS